jgi:hypothetical protein
MSDRMSYSIAVLLFVVLVVLCIINAHSPSLTENGAMWEVTSPSNLVPSQHLK